MEIGNEDRFSTRDKMVIKSSKMEPMPQHWMQSKQSSGKTERWEDDINQFLKPEETEETKGNDLKNNDTWMQVAEDQIRWREMEKYIRNKSERC